MRDRKIGRTASLIAILRCCCSYWLLNNLEGNAEFLNCVISLIKEPFSELSRVSVCLYRSKDFLGIDF